MKEKIIKEVSYKCPICKKSYRNYKAARKCFAQGTKTYEVGNMIEAPIHELGLTIKNNWTYDKR